MLEQFIHAYTEAFTFTDTGDDDQPDPSDDLAPETIAEIREVCADFLDANRHHLDACPGKTVEALAHDFWFSRNGHGVGFWETGRWPEPQATELDKNARAYGSCYVYLGDDGLIYLG